MYSEKQIQKAIKNRKSKINRDFIKIHLPYMIDWEFNRDGYLINLHDRYYNLFYTQKIGPSLFKEIYSILKNKEGKFNKKCKGWFYDDDFIFGNTSIHPKYAKIVSLLLEF